MASDILHIKDSYYFEIPKFLLRRDYKDKKDFPDVWIKLDDQFQDQEFHDLYHSLEVIAKDADVPLPSEDALHHDWHEWHHDHAHHGKPLDVFLETQAAPLVQGHAKWVMLEGNQDKSLDSYLKAEKIDGGKYLWFAKIQSNEKFNAAWTKAKAEAGGADAIAKFRKDSTVQWDAKKIEHYNFHLSGKILIPQPVGELRNLYEPESGFCISKFMVIELFVALIVLTSFAWVARKVQSGNPPKGRLWNLLETFLVFLRDQVVYPSLASHDDHGHDDHGHDDKEHGHAGHGHGPDGHKTAGHDAHGHDGHGHPIHHAHAAKEQPSDARRFLPIFWTIFFFVLGCNLFGMLPWFGAPTGSFSVTLGLAIFTLVTGMVLGMMKFGFVGYWLNQIPGMDLPAPIAIFLKPMIFAIEVGSLLIKHGVLAIRLLLNMLAGHLVILAIMGLAFGFNAMVTFQQPSVSGWWPLTAVISVVASTLLSILELFVGFLQAYIFTFLSALFIGAAIHKH